MEYEWEKCKGDYNLDNVRLDKIECLFHNECRFVSWTKIRIKIGLCKKKGEKF